MSRSLATTTVIVLPVLLVLAGCNSDPYCQRAIANLRAEKIQLENQYYGLKAQYESDMTRLGQPIQDFPAPGMPEVIEGEIIDDGVIYSSSGIKPLERVIAESARPGSGVASRAISNGIGDLDSGGMSQHIRNIEMHQLMSRPGDLARLLIRPLDEQGAIIPVAGDLKIRLVDPDSGTTVYENEFTTAQVAGWVRDQPGQHPGIHVSIPASGPPSLFRNLVCDLQFRTVDNRILKQSTNLTFASNTAARDAGSSGADRSRPRDTAPPLVPDDLGGQLQIEIGDELNFEAPDSGPVTDPALPEWQPDR